MPLRQNKHPLDKLERRDRISGLLGKARLFNEESGFIAGQRSLDNDVGLVQIWEIGIEKSLVLRVSDVDTPEVHTLKTALLRMRSFLRACSIRILRIGFAPVTKK